MPELLASYAAAAESYDEAVAADGSPRPAAMGALRAVAGHDLDVLAASLMHDVAAIGMTFRSIEGDERYVVDPVPRVIAADEWARLEVGLAQRVRALNAFVADVRYRRGDRRDADRLRSRPRRQAVRAPSRRLRRRTLRVRCQRTDRRSTGTLLAGMSIFGPDRFLGLDERST